MSASCRAEGKGDEDLYSLVKDAHGRMSRLISARESRALSSSSRAGDGRRFALRVEVTDGVDDLEELLAAILGAGDGAVVALRRENQVSSALFSRGTPRRLPRGCGARARLGSCTKSWSSYECDVSHR